MKRKRGRIRNPSLQSQETVNMPLSRCKDGSPEKDLRDGQSGKQAALIITTLSSFLNPFMFSSINVALPSIEKEFAMDAILLSWVLTSYILASAVCLVPFGRMADIFGRKKLFTYGIIFFSASSLLCALSFSAWMLILSRILQGIGGALIYATSMAILTSVFPPQERGKALGINAAAVYLGLSVGPFLGGLLTQHLNWRSIFLASIPLGLIVLFLIPWKLKGEWAEAKGERFDLTGSMIYGLSLIAVMYGISLLPEKKSLFLVFAGVFGVWVFLRWEMKTKNPVFDLKLFRGNKVFAFSNLAALINYGATFAVTFLLSLFLQYIKALSPQAAGAILVAQPVVQVVFSPVAGRLSDRIEPRVVASFGMAVTTLGLLLFTLLGPDSSLHFILINLILLGFGFALFSSPNTNAVMSSVEKRFYGLASGSLGTMRLLGMMISMGISTMVFAIFIGRVQISMEYYPPFVKSLRIAFILFSALCFGGTFASMVRGKVHRGALETAIGEAKEPGA
jgi:EmrB/QacA subfamily drug resistance transporter